MKELFEYRKKLIARLAEAAGEFREVCESFSNPFQHAEGEWTVHQVASHLRDVDRSIYGERIRRTRNEDNPEFPRFDAVAWMTEHYDRDETLGKILDDLSAHVASLCEELQAMPVEGWSRESRHEKLGGGVTLQLWVEHNLAHIEEHAQALKNAKNG
jgi:hypothetical protein